MMTPTVTESPHRTHATAMRLQFLVANDAWSFTWGRLVLKMHGAKSRFYTDRDDAVSDARELGLNVDSRTGLIYVDSPSE